MKVSLFCSAMCIFIAFAFSVSLMAADEADDNTEKAKDAFDKGRYNFEQKNYLEAADGFREAFRLKPSWKLHYNIGQAEAAAKRYGLALDAFEQYLALGGDEIAIERKQEIIDEVRRLREMVGSVEVQAPKGATVFIDNVNRGTAPLPGRVKVAAAVDHTLVISLDSQILLQRTIRVSGDESLTIVAQKAAQEKTSESEVASPAVEDDMPPESVEQPADETPVAAKRNKLFTVGWIITGTGAGALIGGGISGAMAIATNKDLMDCKDSPTCNSDDSPLKDKQKTLSTLSTTLMIAGGVAAATGVVLLIISRKKEKQQTARHIFVPFAANDITGAQITWRF